MADLTMDIAPPPPSTAPVVVQPIPANASRTIRTGNILAWLGSVVTLLPELLGDPVVAAFINDFASPWARRLFGVLLVGIGLWTKFLRNRTVAPIAGTESAWIATLADMSVQNAPAVTTEGEQR